MSNCRKESVRSRFTNEKKSKQYYVETDSVTSKPTTSREDQINENNNRNLGPLVQTVLDLFPDQDKNFIEVN